MSATATAQATNRASQSRANKGNDEGNRVEESSGQILKDAAVSVGLNLSDDVNSSEATATVNRRRSTRNVKRKKSFKEEDSDDGVLEEEMRDAPVSKTSQKPSSSKRQRTSAASKSAKSTKDASQDDTEYTPPEKEEKEEKEEEDSSTVGPKYYLMKSEPESRIEDGVDVKFSIDDLQACHVSSWEGVRNHEAKNHMIRMKTGDIVFFYHSSCKTPGIVGLARVVKESYPDHSSWNSKSPYFDVKSTKEKPRWFMVDVEFVRKLKRVISLKELQGYPELKDMILLRRMRLSVSPVTKQQYDFIMSKESIIE